MTVFHFSPNTCFLSSTCKLLFWNFRLEFIFYFRNAHFVCDNKVEHNKHTVIVYNTNNSKIQIAFLLLSLEIYFLVFDDLLAFLKSDVFSFSVENSWDRYDLFMANIILVSCSCIFDKVKLSYFNNSGLIPVISKVSVYYDL